MARPPVTSLLRVVLAASAVLSAGCFDTSSTITTADYPTRFTIEPALFRGSLRCGAPALEVYVASLYDVTEGEDPNKRVASSGPIPCDKPVSFGEYTPEAVPIIKRNHYYVVNIDGYDRDVISDPNGDDTNAPRPRMVNPSATNEEVAPKWTTTCGEVPPVSPDAGFDVVVGDAAYNPLRFPTQALTKSEVIVHGCFPLADAPVSDASIEDGSPGTGDAAPDTVEPPDTSSDTSDVADGAGPGDEDAANDGGADDAETEDGGALDGQTEDGQTEDGQTEDGQTEDGGAFDGLAARGQPSETAAPMVGPRSGRDSRGRASASQPIRTRGW